MTTGAVTASSEAGAQAGRRILEAGGNAIDAAVAVALASCVADPCNTGLGGYGGFLVISPPEGEPVCVDFNVWTAAGTAASYGGAKEGVAASSVPAVVAGLATALDRFGTMAWSEVSLPAIAMARDGVRLGSTVARALKDVEGVAFVDECFLFEPDPDDATGSAVRCRQPDLATTLEKMAEHGPGWFYSGPIGDLAVSTMQKAGCNAVADCWHSAFSAVMVGPAPALRLRDATLYSATLGSSGSLCMFATAAAAPETPGMIGEWAERIAAAWSYRFGAPGGNGIARENLPGWIERALAFSEDTALAPGCGHTCHLNVADAEGMMAAMTLTHGQNWFGARWALPGTGVIMNYGAPILAGAEPVETEGRLYGVSNMSPTIAVTDDGVKVAAGCPGGRRIPTIIGLTLARHLFFGLPLQAAVSAPRFHAERRGRATVERERLSSELERALSARFDRVEDEVAEQYYGPFTAIRREAWGSLSVGLDDRWQGFASQLP